MRYAKIGATEPVRFCPNLTNQVPPEVPPKSHEKSGSWVARKKKVRLFTELRMPFEADGGCG
jgi:hypothetical protein